MGRTPLAILMILLPLTSCGGSSSSTTKPTTTGAATPTQPPVAKPTLLPDDPKLAFAKLVFAELAAGNVEALVKLADPLAVLEKTADCKVAQPRGLTVDPKRAPVFAAREYMSRRVDKTRGLKIDVLALTPPKDAPTTLKAGAEVTEGCIAKRDLVHQPISIKIRAQRDNKPAVEQTVTLKGIELEGRWYLIEVPNRIQEKESKAGETVAKMSQFADAMCKCKDKACADKVQDDLVKWATEMARTADRDEQPDPDLAKQASEIMTRYAECMTKAMMAP